MVTNLRLATSLGRQLSSLKTNTARKMSSAAGNEQYAVPGPKTASKRCTNGINIFTKVTVQTAKSVYTAGTNGRKVAVHFVCSMLLSAIAGC